MSTLGERQIKKEFRKRFAKKQDALPRIPAEMGDGNGNLTVDGMEGFVYVRINGKPVPIYNDQVPNQTGLAVWVGYSPEEPRKFQVLSARSETPAGAERGFWTGYAPAKRYEWHAKGGGQDPLWVHQRALTFLRLSISGLVPQTFEVYVNVFSGRIWSGSAWIAVARQDVDIYEHIPTTTGKAAFVLFTIDTTGAVVTTKGSEVDIDVLALSDIPAIPASTAFVCGAVRVYEGQTIVQEGRTNTDIVDLRWTGLSMLSLSVDWDAIADKPAEFPPEPDSTYYPGRTVSASDPSVNDDSGDGYLIGWEWVNSSTGDIFFLQDASVGAAVWLKIASGSSDTGWMIDGPLAVSDPCDVPILITKETEIAFLYVYIEDPGSAGDTVFDVELYDVSGSASVLSSAATIPYNDSNGWVKVALSVTTFFEGDVLIPKITGVATGASGLRAILQATGSGGGGGGAFNLTVTDGVTTVSNVEEIEVEGGIVSDEGGGVAKIAAYPTVEVLNIVAAAKTTTSASYADHDATNSILAFTKLQASTDLLVEISATLFSTGANTHVKFGIYDGTTDHDVASLFINPATTHMPVSGFVKISGLAAGSYTLKLRWLRSAGSGTLTTNADDRICIKAMEVL